MERSKRSNVNNQNIPYSVLQKSNLSWDEAQLIEYIRSHPEELNEILNLFKKDGEKNAKEIY